VIRITSATDENSAYQGDVRVDEEGYLVFEKKEPKLDYVVETIDIEEGEGEGRHIVQKTRVVKDLVGKKKKEYVEDVVGLDRDITKYIPAKELVFLLCYSELQENGER